MLRFYLKELKNNSKKECKFEKNALFLLLFVVICFYNDSAVNTKKGDSYGY